MQIKYIKDYITPRNKKHPTMYLKYSSLNKLNISQVLIQILLPVLNAMFSDPFYLKLFCFFAIILRMRDSYKRFVKTWIRFDSQVTNPDLKRFVSYRGSRILTLKDSFRIVITNPVNFRKIQPVFTNPTNPYQSLVLWHLRILKFWIRESEP